jgi:hypothetical protein
VKLAEYEKNALQFKANETGRSMSNIMRSEGISNLEIAEYDLVILDVATNTEFLKVCFFNPEQYEDHFKSIGQTLLTDNGEKRIIKSVTLTDKQNESKKTINSARSKTLNTILCKLEKISKFQERKRLIENANKI